VKVLFLGSNPQGEGSLTFERDITALQIRALGARGLGVEFIFLPRCPLEDLPQQLATILPDVLHFNAHGGGGDLILSDSLNRVCRVSSQMISSFLDPDHPPLLVYLSACNSGSIAEELSKYGTAAIGTTADITNQAARAAALCFYDRLIRGLTVDQAQLAANNLLAALNTENVESKLFDSCRRPIGKTALFNCPRIVAEPMGAIRMNSDGELEANVKIGLMDYPRKSTRVAFLTGDRSFETEEEENWGADFSDPDDFNGRVCWSDAWSICGDFTIVVVAFSSGELTFCGESSISYALKTCAKYRPRGSDASTDEIESVVKILDNHYESSSDNSQSNKQVSRERNVKHKEAPRKAIAKRIRISRK
jgi:hypothetical protein